MRSVIMSTCLPPTTNEGGPGGHYLGPHPPPNFDLIFPVLSDVDTNAGLIKPETGDVTTSVGDSTSSSGREGGGAGYSDQYWTPQYSISTSHYHNTVTTDHLQEGEEDSGDITGGDMAAHYRDSAGPIRGYPAARSDAFVWRPY